MGFGFCTVGESPIDRLAYWTELISKYHAPVICFPTKVFDFSGQIFVNDLGPSQISYVQSGPVLYRRDTVDTKEVGDDHFLLHLAQGGDTYIETDGSNITVPRGDMM